MIVASGGSRLSLLGVAVAPMWRGGVGALINQKSAIAFNLAIVSRRVGTDALRQSMNARMKRWNAV